MSLWYKLLSQVAFDDIDRFCATKLPEGVRLDYKLHFPGNLEKTIAAFANTLGGLILLGIDTDKKTNTPVWPPVTGLASNIGLEERVFQKATEAIYPPVRVSVSPVIEIPALPGNVALVVRVDESKDAPHAVEKGRKVYVYERSDNKTDPIQLAHIDRIAYLLERRKRIEEEREQLRSFAILRAERLITPELSPVIWVSVIPLYPWRPLCKPSACHVFLKQICSPLDVQRIPNGAMFISLETVGNLKGLSTAETITCDANGHFLYLRALVGLSRNVAGHVGFRYEIELSEKIYQLLSVQQRFGNMLKLSRDFFHKVVERPGLLSIKIGMKGVRGISLYDPDKRDSSSSKRFLDDEYRDEVIVTTDEFLSGDSGTKLLNDRIAFAFDVETPEGQ